LSGVPGCAFGQVNVRPSRVNVAAGVRLGVALANAWAEKLAPPPSKLPAVVLASSLTATLLNAAASEGYGGCGSTRVIASSELPGPAAEVNLASAEISNLPGCIAAGTLTCQVVCTVWPGVTVANVDGEVARAVQSLGTVTDIATFRNRGPPAGLGSVVVAVNVEPGCGTAAALSVNGSFTRIGVAPVTPWTVTLMVAAPGATVVTVPVSLTLATFGSLLR
jgi:hypothetical protein